jgi:hypothetical protein
MDLFYFSVIGVLIIYIIIVTIALLYYNKKESFQNKQFVSSITFLTAEESAMFLQHDRDGYVKNLTKADLHARRSQTPKEYLEKITKCTFSFQASERNILTRCAYVADRFLEHYKYDIIDCIEIANIPWKFALICDQYEEGLPHTRENIIFLSKSSLIGSEENIVSTLIHEKVHIYQRHNTEIMDKVLASKGYTICNSPEKYQLRRSNPDITDTVYINPYTGKKMIFIYKSDKPSGINDVYDGSIHSIEHPYEQIAYDIANAYLQIYLQRIVKEL